MSKVVSLTYENSRGREVTIVCEKHKSKSHGGEWYKVDKKGGGTTNWGVSNGRITNMVGVIGGKRCMHVGWVHEEQTLYAGTINRSGR